MAENKYTNNSKREMVQRGNVTAGNVWVGVKSDKQRVKPCRTTVGCRG